MKTAFVYAGQGSQKVGMGRDFYEQFSSFKNDFDEAAGVLNGEIGVDVRDLCFEGPLEKLSLTAYTQPAMVAFAIGVTNLLKAQGLTPDYTCGLSLGEYSALYTAGAIDAKSVLSLVAKRGRFMTEAAQGLEVKMYAVLGLDRETVINVCQKVREKAPAGMTVSPANFNCPGQIVISGNAAPVDEAAEELKAAGAKRVLPLNVSGPFHTTLMKPAGDKLKSEIFKINFLTESARVVYNCIGRERNADETIASLLEKQVQQSVYMEDSIRYIAQQGVDTFVEIGPGKVISGFVKKTVPEARTFSIDTVADFENVVEELKK